MDKQAKNCGRERSKPARCIITADDLSPEDREEYEERAAIMEYHGGKQRGLAEKLALDRVRSRLWRQRQAAEVRS